MSFDVNIGRTQPVIKAAANMNNDGGSGGNLGYMTREKKKINKNVKVCLMMKKPLTLLK